MKIQLTQEDVEKAIREYLEKRIKGSIELTINEDDTGPESYFNFDIEVQSFETESVSTGPIPREIFDPLDVLYKEKERELDEKFRK